MSETKVGHGFEGCETIPMLSAAGWHTTSWAPSGHIKCPGSEACHAYDNHAKLCAKPRSAHPGEDRPEVSVLPPDAEVYWNGQLGEWRWMGGSGMDGGRLEPQPVAPARIAEEITDRTDPEVLDAIVAAVSSKRGIGGREEIEKVVAAAARYTQHGGQSPSGDDLRSALLALKAENARLEAERGEAIGDASDAFQALDKAMRGRDALTTENERLRRGLVEAAMWIEQVPLSLRLHEQAKIVLTRLRAALALSESREESAPAHKETKP